MRVVLDTNVIVRATKSATGPAREILGLLSSEPNVLIVSRHILTELVRVLEYPRVAAMHRLTHDECREFVAGLEQAAAHVELPEPDDRMGIVPADADDDPVIATALAGQAEVLCTLDRHFQHPDVRSYCEAHGVRIVTDIELLAMLREAEPPGPPAFA